MELSEHRFYGDDYNFLILVSYNYFIQLQLQLYTAKSQYWLHEAGASPEHWQIKINN